MTQSQYRWNLLLLLVGMISLPYIFNSNWPFTDASKQFIRLMNFPMVLLFCVFIRSLGNLSTNGMAWKGEIGPSGIERAMQYRDAKLNGMTPEQGARLLSGTQVLDTLANRFDEDSATGRAARYMNGRLMGMTPEDGMKYLKGERK